MGERERETLTIESPLLPQEAHIALGVAPDQTNHNSLFLAALEPVDASQLDAREDRLQRGEQSELSSVSRPSGIHISHSNGPQFAPYRSIYLRSVMKGVGDGGLSCFEEKGRRRS